MEIMRVVIFLEIMGGLSVEKIKVVQWGLGSMGSGSAKMALRKEGMEVVGAIANSPGKAGRDLGEFLGEGRNGIVINNDYQAVLQQTKPDVVLLSTHSFIAMFSWRSKLL